MRRASSLTAVAVVVYVAIVVVAVAAVTASQCLALPWLAPRVRTLPRDALSVTRTLVAPKASARFAYHNSLA